MDKYDDIARKVIDLIADEWIKQGHDLTGAFRERMQSEIVQSYESTKINIYDTTERGYGIILNRGVRPENIKYPFARARIAGLTRYFKLRKGLDDKEALSAAFATAAKHKKEGMPTKDSEVFSQTGKRTQFVEDATKEIDEVVRELMNETVEAWL